MPFLQIPIISLYGGKGEGSRSTKLHICHLFIYAYHLFYMQKFRRCLCHCRVFRLHNGIFSSKSSPVYYHQIDNNQWFMSILLNYAWWIFEVFEAVELKRTSEPEEQIPVPYRVLDLSVTSVLLPLRWKAYFILNTFQLLFIYPSLIFQPSS